MTRVGLHRRLSVRLIASHVLVAVISAVTVYAVVRLTAPGLFVERLGLGGGQGRGQGQGRLLREAFRVAVDQANLIGGITGVIAAGVVGAFAAYRLLGPLRRIGAATERISGGHYDETIALPSEVELAGLAESVNRLGGELSRIEGSRVRLIGEVAHEMRTPLTIIDGHIEGMIDGVLPTSADNLAVIGAETRRLRRLSDDLSSLSRAAEHRFDLSPQPHDLGAVAATAAQRLLPAAHDAGVELHITTTPTPAVFDEDRIDQVITNLVRNAIRATPEGGHVTVSTGTAHSGTASSGGAHGGTASSDARHMRTENVQVSVQDTGEGLAPENVERVFERFYRVPGRRGPSGGSGIGLTIAREMVRAHGGELTASSAGLGRGSQFVAVLPAAQPPVREGAHR